MFLIFSYKLGFVEDESVSTSRVIFGSPIMKKCLVGKIGSDTWKTVLLSKFCTSFEKEEERG